MEDHADMASYEDDVFNLPISGHYDCGYNYGANTQVQSPTEPPKIIPTLVEDSPTIKPMSKPSPRQQVVSLPSRPVHAPIARPVSPPVTLPNAFRSTSEIRTTEHKENDSLLSPRKHDFEDESDLTSLSSSHKASTLSSHSSISPSCSIRETVIEPDKLPSHSNPQQLSPTQSRAFAGPRPVQPIRLGRRHVSDAFSGENIYIVGSGQRLKLSKQFVQKVWDGSTKELIGTIAVTHEPHEIALILRGKSITLQKESATSTKWCFKPSHLTKKNAFWYWSKDKLRGDVVLCESKKGSMVIARIQKEILSIERPGMSHDNMMEICFAAMALAAFARTFVTEEEITNLAATIATRTFGEVESDALADDAPEKQGIVRRLTITFR